MNLSFIVIGKWSWAIFIAFTLANAAVFQAQAKKHIQQNPELEGGFQKIIRGFAIWGNIPWVVMGIGCLIGEVPSVFHFFRLRDGNPFVLMFFALVFFLWIRGTYWLLFQSGAEMIAKHLGLLNVDFKSPATVKIYWFLCLAGGVFGVIMMFIQDFPVPLE